VFVCEVSGSLAQKFGRVRDEVAHELSSLTDDDRFEVICFQEQSCSLLFKDLADATSDAKSAAFKFLDEFNVRGETNPVPGLLKAFEFKPDLIVLLSDGDFPDNDNVLRFVAKREAVRRTKINAIAVISNRETDKPYADTMRQIADATGGVYRVAMEPEPIGEEAATTRPATRP